MTVPQALVLLPDDAAKHECANWQQTARGKGMVVARGSSGAPRPAALRLVGISALCASANLAQTALNAWPGSGDLYTFAVHKSLSRSSCTLPPCHGRQRQPMPRTLVFKRASRHQCDPACRDAQHGAREGDLRPRYPVEICEGLLQPCVLQESAQGYRALQAMRNAQPCLLQQSPLVSGLVDRWTPQHLVSPVATLMRPRTLVACSTRWRCGGHHNSKMCVCQYCRKALYRAQ